MKIELLEAFGNDLTVVNAARVSFGGESAELTERDRKLIQYLADNNHMSPFRHVQLRLRFSDVPEFLARQFYKHVVGISATSSEQHKDCPYNEISGRYVQLNLDAAYVPTQWRAQSRDNKQASSRDKLIIGQEEADAIYASVLRTIKQGYEDLLELGVCREQARMLLPMSFPTSWMWVLSLEAAVHLVSLRTHHHAQIEAQDLAAMVESQVKDVAPVCWAALMDKKGIK